MGSGIETQARDHVQSQTGDDVSSAEVEEQVEAKDEEGRSDVGVRSVMDRRLWDRCPGEQGGN